MKSSILKIATAILLAVTSTVSAYNFPTPDWGALLEEKTEMTETPCLELYVEGPADAAPYFGAKFEPKEGVYFGAVAEYASVFGEDVPEYLTYFDMCTGQEDIYFPASDIIRNHNALVTVGFTIHDINNIDWERFRRCLDNLNSYNKPMLIRFANEMNVSHLGNEPDIYKAAFRKAADMVHEYENFGVVWSPNDMGALNHPFKYYWPGEEYVDWVGISSYMKRFFQGNLDTSDVDKHYFMINEYAWHTNAIKPIVKFMEENNIKKPVMISEGGVSYHNKYEGDNTWWALPRIKNMYWNLIMEYPQVKMINYFNVHRPDEVECYSIADNPVLLEAVKEAFHSGAYIEKYGEKAEFAFAKATAGYTLKAENGVVDLYVSDYTPGEQDVTITYKLDGVWYHASNQIPFKCGLDIASLSDGAHTIEIICSSGPSKLYTFYKKANAIRFGAEPEINPGVVINGQKIEFDQEPVIDNGRTLVPMRKIFEALGGVVEWNAQDYVVTVTAGDKKIVMGIGNSFFWVGDEKKELDVPSKIINGRTLVPVRAISEALDCQVVWDAASYTVNITK